MPHFEALGPAPQSKPCTWPCCQATGPHILLVTCLPLLNAIQPISSFCFKQLSFGNTFPRSAPLPCSAQHSRLNTPDFLECWQWMQSRFLSPVVQKWVGGRIPGGTGRPRTPFGFLVTHTVCSCLRVCVCKWISL